MTTTAVGRSTDTERRIYVTTVRRDQHRLETIPEFVSYVTELRRLFEAIYAAYHFTYESPDASISRASRIGLGQGNAFEDLHQRSKDWSAKQIFVHRVRHESPIDIGLVVVGGLAVLHLMTAQLRGISDDLRSIRGHWTQSRTEGQERQARYDALLILRRRLWSQELAHRLQASELPDGELPVGLVENEQRLIRLLLELDELDVDDRELEL